MYVSESLCTCLLCIGGRRVTKHTDRHLAVPIVGKGFVQVAETFNSDISQKEFDAQLKECRTDAPKAVSYLIQKIKKQKFNEDISCK